MYHLLGEKRSFNVEPYTKDIKKFGSDDGIDIYHERTFPLTIDGKSCNRKPDIVIFHHEKLMAVVQIKINLPKGLETLHEEIKTLDALREDALKKDYPEPKALLILFNPPSEKVLSELDDIHKNKKKWFNYLILNETTDSMYEKLKETLGLERILGS